MTEIESVPIVVTGFHRSGTSAVSRLLQRAGLDLGGELIGPRASNPFGHFEDIRVVALHNRLLTEQGLDWRVDHPEPVAVSDAGRAAMAAFARRGLWGFKDPRACYFLDAWEDAVGPVHVVGMIRHPAAAAASLRRRELRLDPGPFTMDPDLALRMWVGANRLLLDRCRNHPGRTVLMTFTRLRSNGPLVSLLRGRWGIDLDQIPTAEAVGPAHPADPPPRWRARDDELVGAASALWAELVDIEAETWMMEAAHA